MTRIQHFGWAALVAAAAVGCGEAPVTTAPKGGVDAAKPAAAVAAAPAKEEGNGEKAPAETSAVSETAKTDAVETAPPKSEPTPTETATAPAKEEKPAADAPAKEEKPAVEVAAAAPEKEKKPAKPAAKSGPYDPTAATMAGIAERKVGKNDWPQWGGWAGRNNTPAVEGSLPTEWDIASGENILWSAYLGSQTYGNTIVANGKVYVGTNNGHGYIKRYPSNVDLGCMVCFDEKTGKFLWQHSNTKLPTGRVHDWPLQGVCASAFVDGDRVWYVSNRGEVVCLDPEGFHDGKNNGPFKAEESEEKDEADIIWKFDMMGELGVSQHNMCACSIMSVGDTLFVCTSNGVDESHINIPAPNAPSFIALNRDDGKLLWSDKSPGVNIIHGQWSSPAWGVFDGQEQIIFAGGDSWIYSFDPKGDGKGNAKLLWKFDGNPKESRSILGGRGTRNEIISTPVIYDGNVYVALGQDPEHGEGPSHVWCIDPTKRGDVSPTLVLDKETQEVIPHRRLQAYLEWEQIFTGDAKLAKPLAEEKVTDELREEFKKAGKPLPEEVTVKPNLKEGEKPKGKVQDWLLSGKVDGKDVVYRVDIDAGSAKAHTRTNEIEVPNKNSAVVWHYSEYDLNGNGKIEFEETMHRTIGTPAIKDDLFFIADFSGLVHCLDAKSGKLYWTHDMFAASWGSVMIADGKVLIGDEDGDVTIFELSKEKNIISEINMENAVYSTPIVANGVLYIANKSTLFAIKEGAKSKPLPKSKSEGASDE